MFLRCRLVNYAQLLREVQGKVDEAERLLYQANAADPTDALPYCALGNLLRDSRKDNTGARKVGSDTVCLPHAVCSWWHDGHSAVDACSDPEMQ